MNGISPGLVSFLALLSIRLFCFGKLIRLWLVRPFSLRIKWKTEFRTFSNPTLANSARGWGTLYMGVSRKYQNGKAGPPGGVLNLDSSPAKQRKI